MTFNLRSALEQFSPADKEEKASVEKIKQFLNETDNAYSRTNLAGHITAGALVVDGHGMVLLNHHKVLNKWLHFGGHSDGEENSLNVAKREVLEESGISNIEVVGGGDF